MLLVAAMVTANSCSTSKNTSMTRFWHAFTAKYNTYFNGTQAYIAGSLEKENGNKDNYTERLPLYTVSNKNSRELGKGNYETAILKAEKAIQIHSIKAKPEWNKSRRKTKEDIEWLSRKEYNPFLWRAWMLMGRSQFYKGDFDEAAATFSYMSRLYKGQPSIYGKARAWLAKCYIESDWIYDAEDVIRNMMRDSIDWRAQKEWDYTLCDYYLHTDDVPKATEYLRKVIKHEMRSKQRAREYFLLGQLEASQGHRQEAYDAFRKVIRQHPPYQLQFNARIAMTEVMAEGQAKKMIGKLKRMARNDNNKEYLDQVYYAIGNIYLAEKDTANAISAYETGNKKATRSGIEKGVLLLHLGDLYWEMEKYGDAKRCYGEAIGLLDKERPDYKELSDRSKVLDELVPYTDAIELQDSLLELSAMPEKERLAAIDRVIKELKEKEKEEEAKQTEAEVAKREQKYGNPNMRAMQNAPKQTTPSIAGTPGAWYFYNTQAVVQGKQTFQRLWGRRENTDDWQRSNVTVVGNIANEEATDTLSEEQRDSLASLPENKEKAESDTLANDPHNREYYLAQIPFTEEQKAACHEIIKDGLAKSAVIFKDKLDNLRLSEKQFKRLRAQYPDYEPKDEMYYHLFLLHSRKGEHDVAATFVDSLKTYCAESDYTIMLTDPYFAENAKFGKHIEDSLYGATYEAFKEDKFSEVYANAEVSEKRFPLGANRDRFIFFYGMTKLNDGDADECVKSMETVVKDYPKSDVSQMAGMIINGVKAGKKLHGAKFDLTNVWDRRNMALNAADTTNVQTFTDEKNTDFLFMMAYAPDSINENKLLFQMARYNFTSFMVRNFDIVIDDSYGMHHMIVSGFRNFDEARQYSKILLQQEGIRQSMGNARPIIISEDNLALIGSRYSYNDYDTFYVSHFAPLPVSRPEQLYEQTVVKSEEEGTREDPDPVKPNLPTEEVAPGGAKPVDANADGKEGDSEDDSMIALPDGTEIVMPTDTEIEVSDVPQTKASDNDSFAIPAEPEAPQTKASDNDTFAIPAEPEAPQTKASDDDTFAIPAEPEAPQTKAADDDTFAIPAEPEAPQTKASDDDTFAIPAEPEAPQTTASDNDNFAIPAEPAAPQTKASDDDTFAIPAEPEAPQTKASDNDTFAIPAEPEAQQQTEKKSEEDTFTITEPVEEKKAEVDEFPIQEEEKTEKSDEVEFVVSDETVDTPSSTEVIEFSDDTEAPKENDKQDVIEFEDEGKESLRDIEDEYYELDGF